MRPATKAEVLAGNPSVRHSCGCPSAPFWEGEALVCPKCEFAWSISALRLASAVWFESFFFMVESPVQVDVLVLDETDQGKAFLRTVPASEAHKYTRIKDPTRF